MNKEKLLVSVIGNRNSGKSHTWNTLFESSVKTGKNERKLYFNDCEFVKVFLVNGSPEERNKDIGDLITIKDPSIVLCSTQYRKKVKETFNHFIKNEYFLYIHWLNPGYSDDLKPYSDNLGLVSWLLAQQSLIGMRSGKLDPNSRVNEMKDFIYCWAKARDLVINKCK